MLVLQEASQATLLLRVVERRLLQIQLGKIFRSL